MLIQQRLSERYTGDQPVAEEWMEEVERPRMVGIEGPQMSMSMMAV